MSTTPAEREYPTFGPEDDDFHDAVMSDRWWETETCWFSWNVPERKIGGWTYCQARPNARLCNGGVWVWDDRAAYSWELPYHVNYSGLQLPDERDLRDFEWPNGVHVRCLEPLMKYEVAYADPPDLEVAIVFDAIMAPNPHPVGVAPFLRGTHFDQAGHVTGEMVLHGERITIDCLSVRDRSWGPRPQGRPKRRPASAVDTQHTGAGGVGYCFGTASRDDAFLAYSIPSGLDDPVMCGFLIRGGEYAHILSGVARGARRPVHRMAGPHRDRGGRRRGSRAPRGRRGREPVLARPRRRHADALAVGRRRRGVGRGPELLLEDHVERAAGALRDVADPTHTCASRPRVGTTRGRLLSSGARRAARHLLVIVPASGDRVARGPCDPEDRADDEQDHADDPENGHRQDQAQEQEHHSYEHHLDALLSGNVRKFFPETTRFKHALRSRRPRALALLAAVLGVGDVLAPGRRALRDRDVAHEMVGCRAVPVLVRVGRVVDVAGSELDDRFAA